MSRTDREWLLARLCGLGNELTDDALASAVAFAEGQPRRLLTSAALASAQRARESGESLPSQPVDVDLARRGAILSEVGREVQRAILLHGRAMPGGFGNTGTQNDRTEAERAKARCGKAQQRGDVSWRLVLEEEVAEAFAEKPGSMLQRAELVQVEAVVTRWIEAIDAHQAAGPVSLVDRLRGVGLEVDTIPAASDVSTLTEDERREGYQSGKQTGMGLTAGLRAVAEGKARKAAAHG